MIQKKCAVNWRRNRSKRDEKKKDIIIKERFLYRLELNIEGFEGWLGTGLLITRSQVRSK